MIFLLFRKDAKTISQFFMTKNGDKKNYKVLIPFTQSSWIFFMCDLQYYTKTKKLINHAYFLVFL